jgi:hypothetical protein
MESYNATMAHWLDLMPRKNIEIHPKYIYILTHV